MWIRRATSAHRCVCVPFKGVPHHICVSAHVNASRHNQFYARLVLQKMRRATCEYVVPRQHIGVSVCLMMWYSQSYLGWHFRKLKAQSSNVSFATFQRKETFELWALSFETAFENVTPSGIGCTSAHICVTMCDCVAPTNLTRYLFFRKVVCCTTCECVVPHQHTGVSMYLIR